MVTNQLQNNKSGNKKLVIFLPLTLGGTHKTKGVSDIKEGGSTQEILYNSYHEIKLETLLHNFDSTKG